MAEKWRDMGKRKRIAATPALPGVWRTEGGGWWVRGRTTDPRTGRRREVSRFLEQGTAREAYDWLQGRLDEIRSGMAPAQAERIRFAEFAASLFERKVEANEIRSAAGRVKWAGILEKHILPTFGDFFCDAVTNRELQAWRRALAQKVHQSELAPTTANGWIAVMKVIMKSLAIELELDRDPGALLQPLPTVGHRTYTPESPNSLKPEDVPRFLGKMRELYPGHHAMCMLGFLTGLRPSTLRPIRRLGLHADVLWDERALLVRRSHTYGGEVMESTKTGKDGRIALPDEMLEVLRQHIAELRPRQLESDLLFPSHIGGFRSRSCLDKPFRDVRKELGLPYPVTPRAMRRTYQDLARAAGVPDLVTRSISGHATEAMQHHYSTVRDEEQRRALEQMASLIGRGDGAGDTVRATLLAPHPNEDTKE